jgi:hypothetical protein
VGRRKEWGMSEEKGRWGGGEERGHKGSGEESRERTRSQRRVPAGGVWYERREEREEERRGRRRRDYPRRRNFRVQSKSGRSQRE